MSFEVVERDGVRYAEVIRADARVELTKFYSPAESSFQFGLLAHGAGFVEEPHEHKPARREILDVQQMLVVQRGVIAIEFYTDEGQLFHELRLLPGDAMLLVHGIHALRVIEDMQCISVKQGPFYGAENDKVLLSSKAKR